jgi:hypothetical protein
MPSRLATARLGSLWRIAEPLDPRDPADVDGPIDHVRDRPADDAAAGGRGREPHTHLAHTGSGVECLEKRSATELSIDPDPEEPALVACMLVGVTLQQLTGARLVDDSRGEGNPRTQVIADFGHVSGELRGVPGVEGAHLHALVEAMFKHEPDPNTVDIGRFEKDYSCLGGGTDARSRCARPARSGPRH